MKIGITGHQRLPHDSDWKWVTNAVESRLSEVEGRLVAVSSLAIGADQLLSQIILERGGASIAILPYADIERSFSAEDVVTYRQLVSNAEVEILDTAGDDEDKYLAAGKRVVDLSELLIAVWNGKPAKGKGGTADIVEYARASNKPLVIVDPTSHTITEF